MSEPTPMPGPISSHGHLLRILGLGFGLAMAVGSMIGGGILRTPGLVAQMVPYGSLIIALWLAGGLHAMLTANIVSEVMTAVPKNGGLYNAAGAAFGDFGALIVAWTDWLIGPAAIAALAIACADFLAMINPGLEPWIPAIGMGVTGALFALNWAGVREGSLVQVITSAAKGLMLLGLVVAVIAMPLPSEVSQTPVVPAEPLTLLGIVVAYQLITGTYAGWPNPAYFAEEDTEPSSNIPRAMFLSLIAVTLLYVAMNWALLYALPIKDLASTPLPAGLALKAQFGQTSVIIVALVGAVAAIGVINAQVMVSTRVLHAMGRDRYIPALFARVNKGGTPYVALAITAILSMLLAATGQFATVFLIMGALGMFVLVLVDAAFFKLRVSRPDLPRPFRARLYPWLPALALLLDLAVAIAFVAADLWSGLYMAIAIAACIPLAMWARRRAPATVTSARAVRTEASAR